MSHLHTAPIMSNTATPVTTAATPVVSAVPVVPVVPAATATTVLPHGVDGRPLSREELKALKHQNKALKHDHGHHQHGHGLTGTGLPIVGGAAHPVVHGATNVVEHQPIIEREVIVERPVEVRREHHIQPVIHEREHQIQPIIRTEVTTERKDLVTERNVMLPAVVEQPHMATTTTGVLHGTGAGAHHATIGQKIKGTVKEVQGTLTHNPMKKEEGRLLKQGIEPATAGLGTTGSTTRI